LPGSWCPAYSVASSLAGATEEDKRVAEVRERETKGRDEERNSQWSKSDGGEGGGGGKEESVGEMDRVEENGTGMEPVHGVDRPFFHIDLVDAVDTAVRDAMKRDTLSIADYRENGIAS
jgi:sodium-independent sulfate anion transporter 11